MPEETKKKPSHTWSLVHTEENSRVAQVEAALEPVYSIFEETLTPESGRPFGEYGYVRGLRVGELNQMTEFARATSTQLDTMPPAQREATERLLAPIADALFSTYAEGMLTFLEQATTGKYGTTSIELTRAVKKAKTDINALLPEKAPRR